MTQVIKKIKGQKYLYFQDSGKIDGKNKTVSTCIGRADLPASELTKSKLLAFNKHVIKIFKIASVIKKTPYHFERITPESISKLDLDLEESLEFVKVMYDSTLKNLTEREMVEFQSILFTKYVHGTTAIEGNTLTEKEAEKVLATNLTPNNKTVNETLEVSNYNYVRDYLDSQSGRITEKMIKQIHKLLMNGLMANSKDIAGEFRTSQVILKGIGFRPPPADAVPDRLHYLLEDYYNGIENDVHPIELISYFHQKFEEIHPFHDGNGRVGREILNYMLKQSGYPEIYITMNQRSEYLTVLQEGNEGNYEPLFGLILIRMGATIEYLESNTNLYNQMISKEAEQAFKEADLSDVYQVYRKQMTQHRESKELP
jgi:Fic family protein